MSDLICYLFKGSRLCFTDSQSVTLMSYFFISYACVAYSSLLYLSAPVSVSVSLRDAAAMRRLFNEFDFFLSGLCVREFDNAKRCVSILMTLLLSGQGRHDRHLEVVRITVCGSRVPNEEDDRITVP